MKHFNLHFILILALAVVVAGLAAASPPGGGKGHGACMGKGDCPGYDAAATTTIKATIVSIEKEACPGCGMTHVDLVVKSGEETVNVRLGPAWFIDKQDEMLDKDDVIEVFGSTVKHGDDEMLVAAKVTKGEDVLILRDDKGLPVWRGWRRGRV